MFLARAAAFEQQQTCNQKQKYITFITHFKHIINTLSTWNKRSDEFPHVSSVGQYHHVGRHERVRRLIEFHNVHLAEILTVPQHVHEPVAAIAQHLQGVAEGDGQYGDDEDVQRNFTHLYSSRPRPSSDGLSLLGRC